MVTLTQFVSVRHKCDTFDIETNRDVGKIQGAIETRLATDP